MTPRARAAVLVATLTALLGAPASVLGAVNELSSPRASPESGTTATTFTFNVAYQSSAGFPAVSVIVHVAGRSIPMQLVAGTATGGTYGTASTLPAGTWPVTFSADAERGPDPSVGGPTVTVLAPATPAPPPQPTAPPPPPPTPAPPPPAVAPPPAPTPAPQPAEADPADDEAVVVSPSPAPTRTPGPSPTNGAVVGGGRVTPTGEEHGAQAEAPDAESAGSNAVGLILGGGVALVAVVGVAGAYWTGAGRHRARVPGLPAGGEPHRDERTKPLRAGGGAPATSLADDPILAAMGLTSNEPGEAAHGAPVTRSVRRGPGERTSRQG